MAIGERSINDSEQFLKGEYKIEKIDAGHWLIQESFEFVANRIKKRTNRPSDSSRKIFFMRYRVS